VAKGYANVFYFTGGIPEWRYFNYPMEDEEKWQQIKVNKIPPLEFKHLLDSHAEIFLLDTRSLDRQILTDPELAFAMDNSLLAGNYIKGALHCPLVFLAANYQRIPRNRPLLISDWIMKQSVIAAKFLTMQGYEVIGVLKGGTARWQAEGLPLVQGQDSAQRPLSCD
jgi:rhodanese-related sulfurtransferase